MENTTDDLDVLTLVNRLLERRRVIAGTVMAFAVMTGGWVFLTRGYTATSQFIAEQSDGGISQLAGLAVQLGVQIPGSMSSDPPGFYRELVTSADLLRRVGAQEYTFATSAEGGDTLTGNVTELLGIGGETAAQQELRTVRRLESMIDVTQNLDAGMYAVRVTAPWREFAEQLSRALLDEINAFNVNRRQSRSSAERQFIEERLQHVRKALSDAENALREFQVSNRQYRDSPQLLLESERLERQVVFQQQLVTTLAQAFEHARIEEVRNTPSITVVDRPEGSARRSGGLIFAMAIGGFLGGVIAVVFVTVTAYSARQREANSEEFARFRRLVRETGNELTFWRGRRRDRSGDQRSSAAG